MPPPDYDFSLSRQRSITRRPKGDDGKRLAVLTSRGWVECGRLLSGRLRRGRVRTLSIESVERRRVRACCGIEANAASIESTLRVRARHSYLAWLFFPPLGSGSPRWITSKGGALVGAAIDSFEKSLGPVLQEDTAAQAKDGYERARGRVGLAEDRAKTYFTGSGVTSTLVLANSALIFDPKFGLSAGVEGVVMASLAVGTLALVTAGTSSMAAINRTTGRISANTPARIIERSKLSETEAERVLVATWLAAQRRASLIADWKMDRVKVATTSFLIAVGCVTLATIALLAQASGLV